MPKNRHGVMSWFNCFDNNCYTADGIPGFSLVPNVGCKRDIDLHPLSTGESCIKTVTLSGVKGYNPNITSVS